MTVSVRKPPGAVVRTCAFCGGDGRCGRCHGSGELVFREGRWRRRRTRTCHACEGAGTCGLCKGEGRVNARAAGKSPPSGD